MAVFNKLRVDEVSKPTNEIYVVYTGKVHELTEEQALKCQEYLDYLNEEKEKQGNKPIDNGDVYTIVNEQRTPDGKQLYLTEKTTYAHFLAFRDQNTETVKEIFGDIPIPPCPVGNPQTMILAKPESVEAKEAGKGTLNRILTSIKSKGPEILLGIMGDQTAFKGTAQAFGAGLNGKNMSTKKPTDIWKHLKSMGFNVNKNNFRRGAGIWDLREITNQSLENQAGISIDDHAGPVQQLGAVRDDVGNYYFPSLTPVKRTKEEIIQGKPKNSKFEKLISVPANPKQAILKLTRMGINYRVYAPPAIERVQQMIRNRPTDLRLKGAEMINTGRNKISPLIQSGKEKIDSFLPKKNERTHESR